MKKTILAVAVAMLLAGVLAFRHSHRASTKPITSGFTMTMTVVEDGKLVANVRRQVKANGDFLEETDHLSSDGSVSKRTKLAGTATQGAVRVDDANRTLTYFGRAGLIHGVTETDLKALNGYAREDSLLGYRVVVQRNCDQPHRCTEYWVSPELGSDDLKVDMVNDGHRLTKEAISVVKGEPSFEVPDYPTKPASRLANPGKP
ncbi:MAG: hypothetical protein QOG23_1882 [Blastocatellia bacterium]|nr:hypothetical protein [Blastocatellia bacterium]